MRVKICGIRSDQEAKMAIAAGADAVGFLIGLDYRTDDEVTPAIAAEIISQLPPFISSVLVTHRTDRSSVVEVCREINCNTIQLHGDFPLDEIEPLRRQFPFVRIIKAVHVLDSDSIEYATRAARKADAILLDTKTDIRIGGTGITHDWAISAQIVKQSSKPVILAGGLTPDNVCAAVRAVAPYGVDVNSGVENFAGSKSPTKIEAFVRAAKQAGSVSLGEGHFSTAVL
jgi:phosphoribosylanthranilate isomerase